ncbi:MAG: hypothetical protein QOE61_5876 [Micromonosporaceae bacterium]|jgi:hypothetical protein|nr:hypothetical protein [Micromonosporaceae bacterium]
MPASDAPQSGDQRPNRLLTQNREMKSIGAWNWSLPAWAGRLADGRTYNTCPSAGICRHLCYALNGTYRWPVVRARHHANLAFVLDDLAGWEHAMTTELGAAKFRSAWIRIHDAGDFLSDDYLNAWLRICRARPEVNFYCYTEEVGRFRRLVEPDRPGNLLWVYSYGGTQDHLLNADTDRVADVFTDEAASAAAGWSSQEASDLLAVLGPRLVGSRRRNIGIRLAGMQGRRFSEWQAEIDAERAARQAGGNCHNRSASRTRTSLSVPLASTTVSGRSPRHGPDRDPASPWSWHRPGHGSAPVAVLPAPGRPPSPNSAARSPHVRHRRRPTVPCRGPLWGQYCPNFTRQSASIPITNSLLVFFFVFLAFPRFASFTCLRSFLSLDSIVSPRSLACDRSYLLCSASVRPVFTYLDPPRCLQASSSS